MDSKRSPQAPTPIHEFFSTEKKINKLDWKEIFTLGDLNKEYVAQGLTLSKDIVYHTVHQKDKRSVLIIFHNTDTKLTIQKELVLPPEATHTSGLTIYKGQLYTIDYHSSYIYQYDLRELQNKLQLTLRKKVRVTKRNRNFCTFEIVEINGTEYLFVTNFLKDNLIYVFDFKKFFVELRGFQESLLFTSESSFFTQGMCLSSSKKSLFHSVNRFDIDFIYELDLERFIETKNYHQSVIRSFLGPGKMIEDLAVHDSILYTSDESTNKLYKTNLEGAVLLEEGYVFNDVRKVAYYDKLLSHRARVWQFQENTIDAYREVLKTNIKYIEIDIRFSSDNVAYVYHDSFFKEGKKKFRFSEKTWAEVEEYRYDHKNIRITPFEELVVHFATHKTEGQILAVDVKDFGFERYLFELFEKHNILDSVVVFTWTPQIIFEFDVLFSEKNKQFPLYFSHVRVDSLFKYLLVPAFLNYKRFFLTFGNFVLLGNKNYKDPLGKYEKGYHHVSYFTELPEDLKVVLKKYMGGVCVTKKKGKWGDRLLQQYKKEGLKIAVFGAFFGLVKIATQEEFEFEAQKEHVDIVFMDDLSKITVVH